MLIMQACSKQLSGGSIPVPNLISLLHGGAPEWLDVWLTIQSHDESCTRVTLLTAQCKMAMMQNIVSHHQVPFSTILRERPMRFIRRPIIRRPYIECWKLGLTVSRVLTCGSASHHLAIMSSASDCDGCFNEEKRKADWYFGCLVAQCDC